MKIAHLLPHFEDRGNGVCYAATDLACAQSAAGHSIACIGGRSGPLTNVLQDHSVTTYVLADFPRNRFGNLLSLPRLFRVLEALQPEVVHAHSIPTALMAKLLQPFFGFSLVTSVHNMSGLKNIWLGVGDRIFCVSAAMAESMKSLHVPAEKIRVIRNGPLDSPRRLNGVAEASKIVMSKPAIVTVAALQTHKGICDLIEAFVLARKSIPDLSLYVLGDGPEKRSLKVQAERFDCSDRVHFEGFVRDPQPYLAQADIFVLASHREAFGMALAEAREAGCAAIGTNVGGIPEVLEHGRAGIIVPPGRPVELGQTLVQLLTNPTLLRFWQKRAVTNLSWLRLRRVSEETISAYAEMLASPAKRYPERHPANHPTPG